MQNKSAQSDHPARRKSPNRGEILGYEKNKKNKIILFDRQCIHYLPLQIMYSI
jgi:hypothetical protein